MPDDLIKYSDAYASAKASQLHTTDIFGIAQVDPDSETGYGSKGTDFDDVSKFFMKGIQFASDLQTANKTIIGAINEVADGAYTEVAGTLLTGATSITLSDASITTTSTIDIYTDVFGIQPTNAVVAMGSITLTFLAQASDITVKVRVS